MQQVFICSQGHRWEADAEAEAVSQVDVLQCPVCGEWTQTSSFQELKSHLERTGQQLAAGGTSAETTAVQDLAAQDKFRPSSGGAADTGKFQDLSRRTDGTC